MANLLTAASHLTLKPSFKDTLAAPQHLLPSRPGAFAGYWNVTLIPEGARHIRAAHRSRNHLGIAGSEGGGAALAARIPRGGRWQGREVGKVISREPGLTLLLQR